MEEVSMYLKVNDSSHSRSDMQKELIRGQYKLQFPK